LTARERPVVLLLDDLDRADPTSIDLVHALVADGSLRHLLIVVTHRDRTDPSPLALGEALPPRAPPSRVCCASSAPTSGAASWCGRP
jgi:hypothetical protein